VVFKRYQLNVIIGLTSANYSYRNVIVGNNPNCDGCEAVCIGIKSNVRSYSTVVGYDAQTNGLYGVAIVRNAQAKKMVELQ
jgi:hypothetical protein